MISGLKKLTMLVWNWREQMNKECKFCDGGEVLNDTTNSDFAIVIGQDEDGYYIEVEFNWEDGYSDVATYINYCPMCGKKLEQEEAE